MKHRSPSMTPSTSRHPPVGIRVTRSLYPRGRCGNCGKVLRPTDVVKRPPVEIGPSLAVQLALLNQSGMTFGKVIEEILGKDFKGVVVCDFHGACNIIDKTQRGLVHLLPDIKKEREVFSGKLLKRFDTAVGKFTGEGLKALAMPEGSAKQSAISTTMA